MTREEELEAEIIDLEAELESIRTTADSLKRSMETVVALIKGQAMIVPADIINDWIEIVDSIR